MTLSEAVRLLKKAAREYLKDNVQDLGAALAFYSMLSIGPLLLIVLGLAGLFFGHDAAQHKVAYEIGQIVGPEGATAVQDILAATTAKKETNILAAVIGLIFLLIGASGTFGQLQHALNVIWKVSGSKKETLWRIVQRRFFSFSMMIGTSFLLLVSLLVTTGLAAMTDYMSYRLDVLTFLLPAFDALLNIGVLTLLFALIFKYIPDRHIKLCDVWWGAFMTAVLFILGKMAIGFYLGRSGFGSSYGAAGSLVVVLFWVYYSAQILFFGAEFTQVYAREQQEQKTPPPTRWQRFLALLPFRRKSY